MSETDPGILAFGTSVSVNDDLRRSILTEVEEMDKAASKTMESVKQEESIHQELLKRRQQANKEAESIFQGVSENTDSLDMNKQILKDLETTLQVDILGSVVVQPKPDDEGEEKVDEPVDNGFRLDVIIKDKQDASMKIKEAVYDMRAKSKEIEDVKKQKAKLESSLSDSVASLTKLGDRRSHLSEQLKSAKIDKEMEDKRHETLLANIESVDEKTAKGKEAKVDLHSKLQLVEKQLIESQKAADEAAKTFVAEKSKSTTLLNSLQNDRHVVASKKAMTLQDIEEVLASIKQRDECKTRVEELRKERLKSHSQVKTLEETVASIEEDMEQSRHTLVTVEKESVELESAKAKSNDLLATEVLPGKTEYDGICVQLEQAKGLLTEQTEDEQVLKLQSTVAEEQGKLDGFQKEIDALSSAVDDKNASLLKHQDKTKLEQEEAQEELDKIEASIEDYKKKCSDEEARIKKANRLVRKSAHVELNNKLMVLRKGAKLLKQVSKKEQAISEDT